MLGLHKPLLPPWRWWPLVSLATLVLVAVIGLSLSRHPQKPQDHTTANNKKYYSAIDNDSTANFTIGAWASDNHDAIEALAAIVSAFFAIVLTGSTIGLWIVTRTVANAAKESAEALPTIERAYVFMIGDQMRCKLRDGDVFESVNVLFKNVGKTPAVISGLDDSYLYSPTKNLAARSAKLCPVPSGVVIASDSVWRVPATLVASKQEISDARDGCGNLLIYGEISYCDIFGKHQVTGFCWEANFESCGFTLSPNTELNYNT